MDPATEAKLKVEEQQSVMTSYLIGAKVDGAAIMVQVTAPTKALARVVFDAAAAENWAGRLISEVTFYEPFGSGIVHRGNMYMTYGWHMAK